MTEPNSTPEWFNISTLGGPPYDPSHRHLEWLRTTAREMSENYEQIFARISTSKGQIQEGGHEIEDGWVSFLTNWLPPSYEVAKRRYIIGETSSDDGRFETDIIIFRPSYPKILRKRTQVLAAGVAAAFSVKSTIRTKAIAEAVDDCANLQRCLAPSEGTTRKELIRPFVYGLLANSHDWKGPNSQPVANIGQELYKRDLESARHPRESIDLICVADVGVWNKMTNYTPGMVLPADFFADLPQSEREAAKKELEEPKVGTVHAVTASPDDGQNIAVFLTALYSLLAMQDDTMAELARGFGHMGGRTEGGGWKRDWDVTTIISAGLLSSPGSLSGIPNSENSMFFGWTTW